MPLLPPSQQRQSSKGVAHDKTLSYANLSGGLLA